jgi:exonuclease SbcC
VRPLKLAIEGFTAFRDLQEIDFEPLDLFVITGPTGAGKTSILDAMVFALYGQVPRLGGKQGTTDLVSLGTVQARVLFEFSIADKGRYRVARRLKRGAAQTATLERLEGDTWVSGCERGGVRECDRVLNELLGLDFDSFCKAVVLPQGEFHRFLKGDPNERRQVLVSLLGVSYFQRMGAIARQRQADLSSKVERTEEILTEQYAEATAERVQEMYAASTTATKYHAALTASLAKAEDRSSEAAAHDRLAETVAVRAEELDALAVGAREQVDACHAAETAKAEAAAGLTAAAADLKATRLNATTAQTALETLAAQLGTAERLAEAATAAETLHDAGLEEQSAQTKLEKAEETQASARRALTDTEKEETEAESKLQKALVAEKERTLALEKASKRTQKLEQLLNDARRDVKDLKDAREQLAKARAVAEGARTEAQRLRGILDEAVAHLEQHRRANAVAELADGLATGDPCPVCGVSLASPIAIATDLADAVTTGRKNEQTARSAAETAADKAARAAAKVEAAEKQQSDCEQRQSETLDGNENLATFEAESSKAAAAATRAAEQLAKGQGERETLQGRRDTAHDRHLKAVGELASCEGLTDAARSALADVRKRKSGAAKTLTKHFGGEAPENAAEQIGEQRGRLVAATETMQAARVELDLATERQEAARTAVEGAERRLGALDVELTRQRTKAEAAAIASAELLTGKAAPPDLPAAGGARDTSTAELASWCDAVANALSAAGDKAAQARDAIHAEIMSIAAEREIDASDAERALALLRTSERAGRDAATKAQSVAEEAERRAGERCAMEERIKDEREQITILGDLALELRSDRFGDYIILETLDLLASHASDELLRISGERYSLVSVEGDFRVVDHANADEQRSVKTLSGGETFLASLALALALSRHVGDLATEGLGARLEAVFVDEGFGALDPETLEEVIDALERLRADDLVVGVISHVPELAQRIRTGLEVQKDEGRSKIVESVGV